MEQALETERRESRHVRALMESTREFVIYRLEKDSRYPFGSRVVFVSPSIKSLLGVADPYDFPSWFDRVHPDDRPEVVREELDAAPARRQFHKVMRVIASDEKEVRWIQATSTPVVDERGEVTHYDGLIFDVTLLKRAEEMERAAKGRLEEVVAERTAELFSTKAFGLGLGLPLVQKIVSQHGGSVELTTASGQGTKVTLSIPLGRSNRRDY